MLPIVIATSNSGKISEIRDLLKKTSISVLPLSEFETEEVAETGTTFIENAELKASSYARQTDHWTIADDSGLEVFALDGAPGVRSARYAGESAGDLENTEKLLKTLRPFLEEDHRLARFSCAISIADARGNIHITSEGHCEGKISKKAVGTNGFGYDPVFIPTGFSQTFAELEPAIKQELSHRSNALSKIIEFLRNNPNSLLDQ